MLLGVALWLGAAGLLFGLAESKADQLRTPAARLARFASSSPQRVRLEVRGHLALGDPVLLGPLGGERERIGAVVAIHSGSGYARRTWELPQAESYSVTIAIDPEYRERVPEGCTWQAGTTPMDGRWVFETLLPPDKRDMVWLELENWIHAHRDEISALLRPIAEDVVAQGMATMEANLAKALRKRDKEIHALLEGHRDSLREKVVPVLKRELGPSARTKADPILRKIGRELWDALPVWSLGWRAAVDWLPGTRNDRVDKWWKEFVDNKAIPILSKHEPELMKMLEDLIEEGAKNPKVRAILGEATKEMARDPRFRKLVRGVLEDALVRPFEWRALLSKITEKPEHRRRLDALVYKLQPTVQRIAHRLTIKDAQTGELDPQLVKVLRRVVFYKDARWVECVAPGGGASGE